MTLDVEHVWLGELLTLLLRNGAEQQRRCPGRTSEGNTVLLGSNLPHQPSLKISGVSHEPVSDYG